MIGASVFASNIGSEHIVGLAGTAAKNGVAMAQDAISAGLANERLNELVRITKLMGETK